VALTNSSDRVSDQQHSAPRSAQIRDG